MPGLPWDEVAAWGGGGKGRPKGVLGITAGAPAWQCLCGAHGRRAEPVTLWGGGGE